MVKGWARWGERNGSLLRLLLSEQWPLAYFLLFFSRCRLSLVIVGRALKGVGVRGDGYGSVSPVFRLFCWTQLHARISFGFRL